MKKVLIVFILLFPCLCVPLFSFAPSSLAATYYVSWDSGTDQAGCGRSDGAGACKSPWYSGLRSQLSSGDTVLVHARADGNPYNNGNSAVIVPPAGTTWQAATGETVKISITPTWGNCDSGVPEWSTVIQFSGANATIDGFYIWGQVEFGGADNCTIENCDISGGVGARDDFISPIYIHGSSSNYATGHHIYNNKIHDNCTDLSTSNHYCNGTASDQCPLVMTYYEQDTLYENNEFCNSNGPGIRHKGYPLNVTARFNFFHNINSSYGAVMGTDGVPAGPYTYYQNIFLGGIALAPKFIDTGNYNFYNNSLYNADAISYWTGWVDVNFFNNVLYSTQAKRAAYSQNNLNQNGSSFTYDNYNDYYATGSGSHAWVFANGTSSSLTAWKSRTGLDVNSITSDPGFLNGSGSFSLPSDFKRVSYSADGRGGSSPSVMGAYITGNEVIGLLQGSKGQPPGTPSPPSPPQHLGIK